MITHSYNKETGEIINYMKPAEGSTVFHVEEKPAEPAESEARGIPKETIKTLLQQAQANLDGGFVWEYINETTNMKDLLKTIEGDPLVTVSIAAFFAGMKFALENLDIHD